MPSTIYRISRLGLVLLLGVSWAAVACKARTRRTPDDTLVYVNMAITRDLDPRFALTAYDVKLSRLVAPGLTSVDNERLEPQLELAESIVQLDARTVEVVLREGLVFSDGRPVTARDVVFTYESTMDPATNSLYRKAWIERFERIQALDQRRVRFHLVEPLATLRSDLDFGVISEAAAVEGRVVGAGAFSVQEHSPERVILVRNPHYYGALALMEKIEVRTVRDANARLLMLVGGSADFSQNSVRLDLVKDAAERERLQVLRGPSAILTYLMMHNEDPMLADVRVRRAIAHAIDRERIITAKFDGYAVLASGLLPPGHWAYNGDVPRYDYNPQRAMELLDEAGYPDPDGPGGEPRMRLTYKTSADQFRLAVVRVIASQLGEVGIEVEVRSYEFGTFFEDVKRGNYQLATMQTSAIAEPDYYYAYFHSSRIPSEGNWGLGNRWRYRNERVDELTTAGRRQTEGRRELYSEVQQILAEQLPIIPLWHEDNIVVMNVDLNGYFVHPNARLRGFERVTKRK